MMRPLEIPSPSWSGFELGPLNIRAYALCILVGIVVALWLTNKRWRAMGGPEGALWDIVIWAIPFGIVGGRLYHVITTPEPYFGPNGNPVKAFEIWNGGLGIWGAVALGAVGASIGCRIAGVRLSAFADAAAPGVLLAQGIGRWGNWFNQELFGGPTTLPWGLHIDPTNANFPAGYLPGTLFQPTFLYECIWDVLGALVLIWASKKFKLYGGRTFWLYVCIYTFGRLWIEMLRIDEAETITFFGIPARLNVWVSLAMFLISLAIFITLTLRSRRKVQPAENRLAGSDGHEAGEETGGAVASRIAGDPEVWLPGREPQETDGAQGQSDEVVDTLETAENAENTAETEGAESDAPRAEKAVGER